MSTNRLKAFASLSFILKQERGFNFQKHLNTHYFWSSEKLVDSSYVGKEEDATDEIVLFESFNIWNESLTSLSDINLHCSQKLLLHYHF